MSEHSTARRAAIAPHTASTAPALHEEESLLPLPFADWMPKQPVTPHPTALLPYVDDDLAEVQSTSYALTLAAARGSTDSFQAHYQVLNLLEQVDDPAVREKMAAKFEQQTGQSLHDFVANASWYGNRDREVALDLISPERASAERRIAAMPPARRAAEEDVAGRDAGKLLDATRSNHADGRAIADVLRGKSREQIELIRRAVEQNQHGEHSLYEAIDRVLSGTAEDAAVAATTSDPVHAAQYGLIAARGDAGRTAQLLRDLDPDQLAELARRNPMLGTSWITESLPAGADRTEVEQLLAGNVGRADAARVEQLLAKPAPSKQFFERDPQAQRRREDQATQAALRELSSQSPERLRAARDAGGDWSALLGERFGDDAATRLRVQALLDGDTTLAKALELRDGLRTNDQAEIEQALANADLASSDPARRVRGEQARRALDSEVRRLDGVDQQTLALFGQDARAPRGIAQQLDEHYATREREKAAHERFVAAQELWTTGRTSTATDVHRAIAHGDRQREAELLESLPTNAALATVGADARDKYGDDLLAAPDPDAMRADAYKQFALGDHRPIETIRSELVAARMDANDVRLDNVRTLGVTAQRGREVENLAQRQLYYLQESSALERYEVAREQRGGALGRQELAREQLAAEQEQLATPAFDRIDRNLTGTLEAQRDDKRELGARHAKIFSTAAKIAGVIAGGPLGFALADAAGGIGSMAIQSSTAGEAYDGGSDAKRLLRTLVIDTATAGVAARGGGLGAIGATNALGNLGEGLLDGESPVEIAANIARGQLGLVLPAHVGAGVQRAVATALPEQRALQQLLGFGAELGGNLAVNGGDGGRDAAINSGGRLHHPGFDPHSHLMGVVSVDDIAEMMGPAGRPLSLEELLRKTRDAVRDDGDYAAHYQTDEHGNKVFDASGRGRNPRDGHAFEDVHAIETAQAEIERLRALPQSPEIDARIRAIAEDATDRALTATQTTPYDGSYSIRDTLVKQYIDPQERGKPTRPYESYMRGIVRALARDGVTYSEQSQSMKKLVNGAFSQDMVARVLRETNAERAKQGQRPIDIRFLAMVDTRMFGTQETTDGDWKKQLASAQQVLQRGDVIGVDIAGPELTDMRGGGERMQHRFRQLAELVRDESAAAGRRLVLRPHVGEGYVQMPVDPTTGTQLAFDRDHNRNHYELARRNMEAMLDAIEAMTRPGPDGKVLYDPANPAFEIRFGHCTHATPEIAARMKKLGIIAEVNLGSNAVSGALQDDPTTPKGRDTRGHLQSFDDHSLLILAAAGVDIVLGTDGQSVMSTTLAGEYNQAERLIHRFRGNPERGERSFERMRVSRETYVAAGKDPAAGPPYALSYAELPTAMRDNIDRAIEKMHTAAARRHSDVLAADRHDQRRRAASEGGNHE